MSTIDPNTEKPRDYELIGDAHGPTTYREIHEALIFHFTGRVSSEDMALRYPNGLDLEEAEAAIKALVAERVIGNDDEPNTARAMQDPETHGANDLRAEQRKVNEGL